MGKRAASAVGGVGSAGGVVRWSRARRTAIVVLDGALVVGTGVVVGTAAASASGPAPASRSAPGWSATRAPLPGGPDAPAADPTVRLVDESCSSLLACAAVGVYGDVAGRDRGLLETLAAGTWTASEPPLPLDGAQDSPSYLDAVSCPRGGWCTAGGAYEDVSRGTDVVFDTLSGGQWTAEQAPLPADAATGSAADSFLKSIDCTGAGVCAAVGSYKQSDGGTAGFIDTAAGGSWSSQTAPQPAGAAAKQEVHLVQVSCPSVGACAASGSYTNASGNDQALLLEQGAGGSWVAQDAPLPAGAATGDGETSESFGVSCNGAVCEAVGLYADGAGTQRGLLDRWAGGGWSATAAPVPANAGASPGHSASLNAVSCTFDGCVGVGAYEDAAAGQRALVDTVSAAGAVTATEGPQPADRAVSSDASLGAVSCLSVGVCTAVGSYRNSTRGTGLVALTDAASGAGWSSASLPLPPGAASGARAQSTLETVSCTARGACATAGDYRGRRAQLGLLQSYTPPQGYWTNGSDSGVFAFGRARFHGAGGGGPLNQEVVGMAATPDGGGYWQVAKDGGVFNYGDARFRGSAGDLKLSASVVGIAATPSGNGYWLAAADGGVFTFGDAQYFGSPRNLSWPITGIAATPDGHGYWLVAADGGVFAYGDAGFYSSPSGTHLNAPILGIAATATGNGYWLVAADGGVFEYGDARYFGSAGGLHLNQPVVGILPTLDDGGYWLVSSDGGIFSYGNATYHGSAAAIGGSSAATVGGAPA